MQLQGGIAAASSTAGGNAGSRGENSSFTRNECAIMIESLTPRVYPSWCPPRSRRIPPEPARQGRAAPADLMEGAPDVAEGTERPLQAHIIDAATRTVMLAVGIFFWLGQAQERL